MRSRIRERLGQLHWALRASVHRQLTRPVDSPTAAKVQRLSLTAIRTAKPTILGMGYWLGLRQARLLQRFNREHGVSVPRVTVLGSCRQDSVDRVFPVTPIRDCITYPHYTKETLLEIEYLQDDLDLPVPVDLVFRSGLLGDRLPTLAQRRQWFETTDVFIVEIASRKAYEVLGVPVHHELYDSVPQRLNVTGLECTVRRQTDSEIQADLLRIRELLHPRPMLVTSHFCTRLTGDRAELRDLLRALCTTFNIPFFDPSRLLDQYPARVLVEDEVPIAHFTPFGHSVLEGEYRSRVSAVWSEYSKSELCQVYDVSLERNELHGFQGLGDFLMGSLHVMRMARLLGKKGTVSHTRSPLSSFLADRRFVSRSEAMETTYVFKSGNPADYAAPKFVFCNAIPTTGISNEDRDLVRFYCLEPLPNLVAKLSELKTSLGIETGPYRAVHVRLGDGQLVGNEQLDPRILARLQETLAQVAEDRTIQSVVVSDSSIATEMAGRFGLASRLGSRGHVGHHSVDAHSVLETLSDYFVLLESQSILQASVYGWGSTFSLSASVLGGIPLESVQLDG